MADVSGNLYQNGMSPQALAEKVLEDRFGKEMPSIPINPFKLMREYGIVYQLMEFEDLEGIYLVPKDENDIPVVGINYERKITRQRYTAAHELCHHLKDRRNRVCPKSGMKDESKHDACDFLLTAKIYVLSECFLGNGCFWLHDSVCFALFRYKVADADI